MFRDDSYSLDLGSVVLVAKTWNNIERIDEIKEEALEKISVETVRYV